MVSTYNTINPPNGTTTGLRNDGSRREGEASVIYLLLTRQYEYDLAANDPRFRCCRLLNCQLPFTRNRGIPRLGCVTRIALRQTYERQALDPAIWLYYQIHLDGTPTDSRLHIRALSCSTCITASRLR